VKNLTVKELIYTQRANNNSSFHYREASEILENFKFVHIIAIIILKKCGSINRRKEIH
jgi:hypothetical protein